MTLGIQIQISTLPVYTPKFIGWRVLHQAEGGYNKTPPGMPEVIPPDNPVSVPMTEEIQRMSFDLMTYCNNAITPQLWTKVHHGDRAFTNYQGFNMDGDPRCNFITNENIGKQLPGYDKAQRVCGGSFIHGIPDFVNDKAVLRCEPGIHGIDANKSMPSIKTIVSNNWYLFAVTIGSTPRILNHFPQGWGGPVVIPFIFVRPIYFNLEYFQRWEEDELPDPLKIYLCEMV